MSIKNNERLKIKIIIDCIFKTVGAIINCDLLKWGCRDGQAVADM